MSKHKLCFLTPSLSTGGIEMYLLRFLNFLDLDSYEVTLIVRTFKEGELEEKYQNLDIQIIKQPLGYFNPVRIWKYYKLFYRNQFDVVCDFNANFAGIVMSISWAAGIKKRITFFRQGMNHFKESFLKKVYNHLMNRLVYHKATHILSNSHAAIEYFFPYKKETDNRFKVIRNGVKVGDYKINESRSVLRRQLGLPEKGYIIGHVGRLDPAKNHPVILEVFEKVLQTVPEAHLVLCGRGTNRLLPQIKKLGVEADTTLWEHREDIPRVLNSLDCFLFPSLTEGQPNALIEAIVAGVPIVASNIPSIKECLPQRSWNNLRHPMDINGIVKSVVKVLETVTDTKPLQNHASTTFDADTNFNTFKMLLLNE